MSSTESSTRHDETLNDSWEELTFKSQTSQSPSPPNTAASDSSSVIERLLLDAQRESSTSRSSEVGSIRSSSASPRSVRSVNTDLPPESFEISVMQGTNELTSDSDWVWDWSSRPEIIPPWASTHNLQPFKHPVAKRRTYSMRNSRLMQTILVSLENLPLLLLTHACTFILGAATMFVILKKYYKFAAAATASLD